jgi:hypothetical protein
MDNCWAWFFAIIDIGIGQCPTYLLFPLDFTIYIINRYKKCFARDIVHLSKCLGGICRKQTINDVFLLLHKGQRRATISDALSLSVRQVDRHILRIKEAIRSNELVGA